MSYTNRKSNRGGEILSLMSRHPGIYFTAVDVVNELGYAETDKTYVTQTLSRLAISGRIERVAGTRGCYVLTHGATPGMAPVPEAAPVRPEPVPPKVTPPKPEPKPVPPMFEYVGTLQNGDQLMRDEKGNLYTFKQI